MSRFTPICAPVLVFPGSDPLKLSMICPFLQGCERLSAFLNLLVNFLASSVFNEALDELGGLVISGS